MKGFIELFVSEIQVLMDGYRKECRYAFRAYRKSRLGQWFSKHIKLERFIRKQLPKYLFILVRLAIFVSRYLIG